MRPDRPRCQTNDRATGFEAKTIHRLLEVDPKNGGFKRGDDNPLDCDLLVAACRQRRQLSPEPTAELAASRAGLIARMVAVAVAVLPLAPYASQPW